MVGGVIMNPFISANNGGSYWWQGEKSNIDIKNQLMKEGFYCINRKIPCDYDFESYDGKVLGFIAPYGDLKSGFKERVHHNGDDWVDSCGRTCTVTHWKPSK